MWVCGNKRDNVVKMCEHCGYSEVDGVACPAYGSGLIITDTGAEEIALVTERDYVEFCAEVEELGKAVMHAQVSRQVENGIEVELL